MKFVMKNVGYPFFCFFTILRSASVVLATRRGLISGL